MRPCFASTSPRTMSYTAPGGNRDFAALRAYFASLRDAFSELGGTRALSIGDGDYLAARTRVARVFSGVFTPSPVGRLEPHGQAVAWEVLSRFRYNADGRLAEEWVQPDARSCRQQLG